MTTASGAHLDIGVVPTGAALGADVVNFDIGDFDDSAYAVIRKAWLDHLVIRIRGQDFGDPEHVNFARYFGELEIAPTTMFTGKPLIPEIPEMCQVTNKKVDGEPIGTLGDGELSWHTDMSYIEEPPTASLLHALEVPPAGAGGNTSFLNMYMAYDTLAGGLRRAIEGRLVKHEAVHSSDGRVRDGVEKPDTMDVRDYPGALHPVVRTHPETGRKALYLGRRLNAHVVGLAVDESEALLDELWDHTENPVFAWTQEWQVGDMVMWDNRCVMHRRDAFDPDSIRLMHRLALKGDRPH